jgi:hypothetical protein
MATITRSIDARLRGLEAFVPGAVGQRG